jgi:metal-responsive CopG/Arc/MetJ family transcriptional regulator
MSPRTGRPKAERPKSKDIKVRVDEEMLQRLDKYCNEKSVTRAEAIRKGTDFLLNKK